MQRSPDTILGEMRSIPVRCMAMHNSKRCKSPTHNPNCFCGAHQHCTRMLRFSWVHSLESLEKFNFFDPSLLTSNAEIEIALMALALKKELLSKVLKNASP